MDLLDCAEFHAENMRDRDLPARKFRMEMTSLSQDLAGDVRKSEDLQDPVLVPILRAGLGMLSGALRVFPDSEVGFLGITRYDHFGGVEHDHFGGVEHECYHHSLPDIQGKDAIILDPMLATGGSIIVAVKELKERRARRILVLCACAAPEGLEAVAAAYPDFEYVAAVVDDGLDEECYIVPGLGDARDRLYGVAQ